MAQVGDYKRGPCGVDESDSGALLSATYCAGHRAGSNQLIQTAKAV